MGIIAAKKGG